MFLCLKLLLQYRQPWGFSPVWIKLCLFNRDFSLKVFPHSRHSKGFSPVWIFSCLFNWDFSLKVFPHSRHLKGFSPVWILSCLFKLDFSLKVFPHSRHLKGFSVLWPLSCFFNWDLSTKVFKHSRHEKGFSLVWVFSSIWIKLWRFSWDMSLKYLLQVWQVNIFSPSFSIIFDSSFCFSISSWSNGWSYVTSHNWIGSRFSSFSCLIAFSYSNVSAGVI